MSVKLETFDTSAVSALTDARLYEFLTNKQVGVADGVEITSTGGLGLHITSGWGVILGRVFTINSEDIVVNPSLSGTQKGRLILQIDISNQEQPIKFITQASASLPGLRKEDINKNGTVYQLELATYNVSEVSLSELVVITAKLQSSDDNSWSLSGGTRLTRENDLNELREVGNYFSIENGQIPNAPINAPFNLKVYQAIGTNKNWITQEIIPLKPQINGLSYRRILYTEAPDYIWKQTEWQQVASKKDVDAVKAKADAAMPKSGGNFNGVVKARTDTRTLEYQGELVNSSVRSNSGATVSTQFIVFTRK